MSDDPIRCQLRKLYAVHNKSRDSKAHLPDTATHRELLSSMEDLVVSGDMHHGKPGLRGVGQTGQTREQTKVEVTEGRTELCFSILLLTIQASYYYSANSNTYLGIVGYVMLGQCIRGVHP